jgi:hypothetical protein
MIQCNVGWCYLNGVGCDQDYKKAMEWSSGTHTQLTGQLTVWSLQCAYTPFGQSLPIFIIVPILNNTFSISIFLDFSWAGFPRPSPMAGTRLRAAIIIWCVTSTCHIPRGACRCGTAAELGVRKDCARRTGARKDLLKRLRLCGQGLMYTYALGVDSLERKAAENFALYFRRRQASAHAPAQPAADNTLQAPCALNSPKQQLCNRIHDSSLVQPSACCSCPRASSCLKQPSRALEPLRSLRTACPASAPPPPPPRTLLSGSDVPGCMRHAALATSAASHHGRAAPGHCPAVARLWPGRAVCRVAPLTKHVTSTWREQLAHAALTHAGHDARGP